MDALVHTSASQSQQTSGIQETPSDLPADASPLLRAHVKARRAWLGALALSAALAAPGAAWADDPPDLYVGIGHSSDGGCLSYPNTRGTTGPISAQHDCAYDNTHSWASAEADYGLLRSSSKGSSARANSLAITGGSTAYFRGFYTFSGPNPEVISSVTTQLNLDLDGRLSVSPHLFGLSSAALVLNVEAFGYRGERAHVDLGQISNSVNIRFERRSSYPYSFLDAAADWESLADPAGAHLDLETGAFTVPTGTPILIQVRLYTSFFVRGLGGADSDFASTLTFNNDGPVFTLPEGYTVNGTGIVDNHWVGAIPAVPEPATALLSALGLGVVSWRVRRRRVTWTRG
ncbi:MAG: PEP-CTERM sorting domain-containing protein [Burkholderiales bacterium]|nr:PEP-CTERM sorting domain-containing protein [Burkholderiales bacterium]